MFSRVPSFGSPAVAAAVAVAVTATSHQPHTASAATATSPHQSANHHHPPPHYHDDLGPVATTSSSLSSAAASALHPPFSIAAAGDPLAAALTVDDEEFNRLSGDPNWWQNAIEEDSFDSPLPFDASESGLWNGRFVPPPPRPPFLDESIATDGLTTCDLCSWAWHDRNSFSLDASIGEAAGELGWAFTLIIVSVISALLGAIIMVIVLRCRRLKTSNANAHHRPLPWWSRGGRNAGAGGVGGLGGVGSGVGGGGGGGGGGLGVSRSNMTIKQSADSIRSTGSLHNNPGVWTWLGQRRQSASPDHHLHHHHGHHHHHHHHQLGASGGSPAENHYTHMDDSYSPVGLGGGGGGGGGGVGGAGAGAGGGGGLVGGGGGGGGSSGVLIERCGSGGGAVDHHHHHHRGGERGDRGGNDEALYAELDRESIRSANPSYQNTAYSQCGEHDADAVPIVSSAPSSAYYSDLSTTGTATTMNDRGYEVVGMTHMSQPMPSWDSSEHGSNGRRPPRLAAINETSTSSTGAAAMAANAATSGHGSVTVATALTASVPSDYV